MLSSHLGDIASGTGVLCNILEPSAPEAESISVVMDSLLPQGGGVETTFYQDSLNKFHILLENSFELLDRSGLGIDVNHSIIYYLL